MGKKKNEFSIKEGERLCACCPLDRDSFVAQAHLLTQKFAAQKITNDELRAGYDELVGKQDYQFMGYLATNGNIVDEELRTLGPCLPGYVFFKESIMQANFHKICETISEKPM